MSAITIPSLIEQNKDAYEKSHFIESIYLSQILINKALKQVIKEEYPDFKMNGRYKVPQLIKVLSDAYKTSPAMKVKLKKVVFREIELFSDHFKSVTKELKFQYPESKIKLAAALGMKTTAMLNTTLLRIRNNRSEE